MAALLGIFCVAAIWWSYFDWFVFVGQARRRRSSAGRTRGPKERRPASAGHGAPRQRQDRRRGRDLDQVPRDEVEGANPQGGREVQLGDRDEHRNADRVDHQVADHHQADGRGRRPIPAALGQPADERAGKHEAAEVADLSR